MRERERGQKQGLLWTMRGGERSEGENDDPLVVVEDERNGGGFGDKGRENQCWDDVEDMVEGKGTGSEMDQLGFG